MKDYTVERPTFHTSIEVTETTDTNHADNINAAPKQLLENTLVLASIIGGMLDVTVVDGTLCLPVALDVLCSGGTLVLPEGAAQINEAESELEISSQTVIAYLQSVQNGIMAGK